MPEANFDSIVGPTHNYAGLSRGNVASMSHRGEVARPRDAALQGLAKMRLLHDLGVPQGVLPPQARPAVEVLRALGYGGSDSEVIDRASREDPLLLARCSSASAMWAANAATVSSSAESGDGRVHLSVANLRTMFHRMIEAPQTERTLRSVFADASKFAIHPALPNSPLYGDEGAANHTRLHARSAAPDETAGVDFFVHGTFEGDLDPPRRYPARQSLEASQAVARRHGLDPSRVVHARQSNEAIDGGVFHNDVIAVGSGPVLLHHSQAFADRTDTLGRLRSAIGDTFAPIEISAERVSLQDAVASYLFNSQLVETAAHGRVLVAPRESHDTESVREQLAEFVESPEVPIDAVHYVDLRESMRNGGGPACLRLRVPLSADEWSSVTPGCRFSTDLHAGLETWVRRHYRETLVPDELGDPRLLEESRTALDELTGILGVGSIYPFQR